MWGLKTPSASCGPGAGLGGGVGIGLVLWEDDHRIGRSVLNSAAPGKAREGPVGSGADSGWGSIHRRLRGRRRIIVSLRSDVGADERLLPVNCSSPCQADYQPLVSSKGGARWPEGSRTKSP